LARKLGFDFAYHWPLSLSGDRLGVDRSHHAIISEEDFFSEDFIAKYSIANFDKKGFVELTGKRLTQEYLVNRTVEQHFAGWLAPRLDLKDLLVEQLCPNTKFNLGSVFNEIGFHEDVADAIRAAKSLGLPTHCVALHLRSGDIFYGRYRKHVHYTYKGVTLPIAKAVIREVVRAGQCVLLFGQDKDVMQYLKQELGAILLEDLDAPMFASSAARAMFEILLMSRCERIIGGSSGFAKQASWIAGCNVEHPADFFNHFEQTKISIEDLERNANIYHPLQTAFAYWYAYFYGRQSKPFEQADMLLAKAYEYDRENQLYPIKRAVNCFRAERFHEGDAVLRRLMYDEYMDVRSADLPLFQVLTAKILGNFNLAEDFEAIDQAAQKGYPYAAACNYVIKSAARQDAGDALRVLSEHLIGDVVIRVLYRRWAKLELGDGKGAQTPAH
jgi:hypothetical protein